jgi:hypothetical protein
MVNEKQRHEDVDMNIQGNPAAATERRKMRLSCDYRVIAGRRERKNTSRCNFSTTTSFISPYAFVKHDYKTKQQESRPHRRVVSARRSLM